MDDRGRERGQEGGRGSLEGPGRMKASWKNKHTIPPTAVRPEPGVGCETGQENLEARDSAAGKCPGLVTD